MHAIKKSTNRFHDALRGALRHALVVSLLTFGVLPLARATIIGGSVQTGTAIAPTGDGLCSLDPSTTDMNVCTNGQVTYSLEFVGNGGDDPVTLTSQLPVGAVWEALPPSCSGPGSGISADGRTLTCVYPGPVAAGTVRILPTARISGALANGTQLPAPATTIASPQTPAPVAATDLSGPLTVLAKPSYDLIKATHSSPLQGYPGPNGEAGYLLRYSIMISVPAGSVQGQENLVQPIVVTDAVPANAALVEWGAGAAYTCHANSSAIPAYYTGNTNYPPGTGGTCDATQAGAGAPATLTLSGMNLTSGFQSYGNFVADFNLLLWIPASSLAPGNNVLTNSISWSPESISGQDNVDPDLGNQTVNDQVNNDATVVRGNFEKYFNVAPYDGNGRLPADSTGSLLIYTRNPAITPQEKVLCEKYDNTRYQITAAGASMAVAGAVIEYGTGGLNGSGQTWASENDQRMGTCADDQSPAWYTNLASVPGGMAAVTKIRARYLAPSGDSTFQAYFRVLGAYAVNGYATNNGPAISGQSIPVGEKMINWTALQVVGATAATYDQPDDQAVQDSAGQWWGISRTPDPVASVYGDTLYVARAIASVTKNLLPAGAPDIVAAGTVATYRLQPTLDTMNGVVGSTPTSVTLRDVLPPGLGYQPGTASIGEPSVQADVPASGYTTLVWTLDNVLPGAPLPPVDYQVLVDSFVQNSRILPNLVEVISPLDPETCANSTGIYAGMLGNAVINSETGAVGGTLCQRAARHDMSVSNPGGLQLQKTSDTPVISTNGTLQYTLTWGGIQSSVDRTDLIDVLPYNGDGRTPATSYNGGVAGTANLHLENLVGPVSNDGTPASLFYYTSAAAATIARDPGHASNALPGGSTRWCTSAEFGTAGCPSSKDQATAFRVVSEGVLASNTMRSVTVVLRTGGNRAGDVYTNSFNMRGTVDGQPLVALLDSNAVSGVTQAADVIVRKVLTTGGPTAEPGETLSYTITLTNTTGTPATDHAFYESIPAYTSYQSVTGATVAGCATGDAGRKTCTLTVASIPANATAEVVLNVQVANALPVGLNQLYNLVTDSVCDPADATCAPPPACDPAIDANQCITPPVGCDPASDPDHCVTTPVEPPNIAVKKVLTNGGPTAEAGETLTYTITLTNTSATAASNHAFYESIPAYTTFQSVIGATTDCAIGDAGRKTCTLTVAGVPANATAEVVLTVQVANILPAGLTQLYNLVTNGICDPSDATCVPPPACDPATDANQCITPPVGCDPTNDPDHCVVTPVEPPNVTVKKVLTTGGPTAEAGETLSYTITLTNASATAASNHAFYESIPAYTTFQSVTGATVVECAVGDAGRKTCTLTAASVPANGTSEVVLTVQVASTLPAGLTQLYNLVTNGICDPADATCVPPPACDPATDANQCITPPVGCDPTTDPDHCVTTPVTQPNVTVKKVMTAESGTRAGIAENAETLTYTLTLTNNGTGAATDHAFYERLPEYTTLVSIDGPGVTHDCVVGDIGPKLCTITVAGPIAADGGTAQASVVLVTDDPLPTNVRRIFNLITDNIGEPPTGCDPATQVCTPPPACDPATDPNQCGTPLPGCDPATDPDHCVVTPIDPSSITVRKQLTGEDGTVQGFVEPGETLTYTLTLTNDGGQSAAEHVFYEQLPAHVTLVGITGTGVSSNCAAGDVGSKLCQVTVVTPIAGAGGTATVTVVVRVADPLPAGVLTLVNLVTDNTDTPPPGCDPLTQICGGDPELPPQCDPATDPAHCVSTPVAALLTVEKSVLGVPQPVAGTGDEFTVRYAVTVRNAGGSVGRYDLSDTPQFDADASVVSAQSTRGQDTAVVLEGAGPWTLADDRELAAGASDVFTLELRVRVVAGSSQDNDTCVAATPGNGLFNLATMTTAGRDESDDACVDTPKPETTTVLVVEKRGSVREAEMGDLVNYTIRIRNNGTGIALLPVLVDRLPAGFRLVEGSARVSGATLVALDGSPGPVLRLTLDRIDPGAEVQVAYRVRIGVGALEGDGINRAQVECRDTPEAVATTPCSNEDRWEVDIDTGVFSEEGCVAGQVFVDCNYNSIKDREELGIPGVRMYLQDGTFLISDSEGKYSYCGLRPTTHVLKVDSTTLPTGSRMVTSSSRNVGDANSLFIDMKKGELHRADFIEGSCNNEVIEQVKARKAQGEVSSVQTEAGQPPLRFESKPLPQSNPPQQGTDSVNQRIEQTRHGDAPPVEDRSRAGDPG